jgi:tRNA modification GTPase
MAAVSARLRSRDGRRLELRPSNRLIFGRIHLAEGIAEQLVVQVRKAESVDVHCHGGSVAIDQVEQALIEQGCTAKNWRDWLSSHEEDAIRAAARLALADARTERTATILLDQYNGALRRELEGIIGAIRQHQNSLAAQRIQDLLERAHLGEHLTTPWKVVLAGRPNVGKSSLINRLVGYQRAIVHQAPGTTRDVVTATTAIDGWPIELSDTAGLRVSDHTIERLGVRRARDRLNVADLVILVFDSSQPWSAEDQPILEDYPSAVVVHNKFDLPSASGQARPQGLETSALTGQGIAALIADIARRLVPSTPPPGAAVPFTGGQVDLLSTANQDLGGGDAAGALSVLRSI